MTGRQVFSYPQGLTRPRGYRFRRLARRAFGWFCCYVLPFVVLFGFWFHFLGGF